MIKKQPLRKTKKIRSFSLISKLSNLLMYDGKKTVSEKIVRSIFTKIKEQTKENPIIFFNRCIRKIRPRIELKKLRISGSTRQIPMEISRERSISLALRWLIESAGSGTHHTMVDRMLVEIFNISANKGLTFKKFDELNKKAESYRAFAHYRW